MTRYPDEDTARNDRQFAETFAERKARLLQSRAEPISESAGDNAAVAVIAECLGSWLRPGLDARYVARAILAALARSQQP